jgi:LptD protein
VNKINPLPLAVSNHKLWFSTFAVLITCILHSQVKDSLKTVKQDSLAMGELESPIYYSAEDSIQVFPDSERVFLYGSGNVKYEGIELQAEIIEINYKANLIFARGRQDINGKLSGTPVFIAEGETIRCDEITYNLKNKKGIIKNISLKQGDLIVKGEKIKKDSNDVMYFRNLSCIPCEYEDAKTVFKAARAKVIPDDKIITGPMYLSIAGIPTPLALPFGFFPNTKKRGKSGVLLPTYGESPNLGFFLKDGGFYWAAGKKMDMQLRGDIYSYGSWALRNITNYNVRYRYTGAFNVGFSIFNSGEREIPEGNPGALIKRQDFFIRWTHAQDPKSNPNVRFSANVNAGSNSFNQYNAQNSGQYLTNTFASNINFSRVFSFGTFNLNARHNQNTQTRNVEVILPDISFNVNRFFPFRNEKRLKQNFLDKIGMNYILESKSLLNRPDSLFLNSDSKNLIKSGVRHSLPISGNVTLFKNLTFSPSVQLNAWNYFKTTQFRYDSSSATLIKDTLQQFRTAFDASFNGELTAKVYGNYIFKRGKLRHIRHFMIPTVRFTYRPDFTDESFGYYREVQKDSLGNKMKYSVFQDGIYGGPGSSKSGIISYNLNNNLEAKIRVKTDTGYVDRKITLIQNFSISGTHDLMAKEYKTSPLNLSGRTRLWKNIDILISGTLDPYSLNPVTNLRQPIYQWELNGKPARFTGGNIAINTSFNNQLFSSLGTKSISSNSNDGNKSLNSLPSLPWNFNVNYNLSYQKPSTTSSITQTLNFSGDFSVTSKWKVGFTSGYDFVKQNISYTAVNVYRDLHCWEARFDWVPFGFRKRYAITLNLKTSMLRDIKIPRTREWYDNL